MIAVISVTASLIHVFTDRITPEMEKLESETSALVKLRKKHRNALLSTVESYTNNQLNEEDLIATATEQFKEYNTTHIKTKEAILNRNALRKTYAVFSFSNLQSFLYSLGNTITILGFSLMLIVLSIQHRGMLKNALVLSSSALLALGLFWLTWVFYPANNFDTNLWYYVILLVASLLVITSTVFYFKHKKNWKHKVRILISHIVKTRTIYFKQTEQVHSPNQAADLKNQHDDAMFETLKEVSE